MTDDRIIAYLLEELPKEEMEQFEEECFAQESWPTQIECVEEDLIDAYLRDKLTQERRQRFERNYLTKEGRQEHFIMAAALLRYNEEHNEPSKATVSPTEQTWVERFSAFWSARSLPLQAAAVLAVVAIMAGALWLYLSRESSPRTFATLNLAISVNNRAEGTQAGKVKFPLNANALKIALMLPEHMPPAVRYSVSLENEKGETKALEIAEQDAQSVSVVIPAAQLARGQYALKLFAINTDGTEQRINGSYFFIVE